MALSLLTWIQRRILRIEYGTLPYQNERLAVSWESVHHGGQGLCRSNNRKFEILPDVHIAEEAREAVIMKIHGDTMVHQTKEDVMNDY